MAVAVGIGIGVGVAVGVACGITVAFAVGAVFAAGRTRCVIERRDSPMGESTPGSGP